MSLETVSCSFCCKRGNEVDSIVAGPTPAIAICNECIDVCAQISAEPRPGAEPSMWHRFPVQSTVLNLTQAPQDADPDAQ